MHTHNHSFVLSSVYSQPFSSILTRSFHIMAYPLHYIITGVLQSRSRPRSTATGCVQITNLDIFTNTCLSLGSLLDIQYHQLTYQSTTPLNQLHFIIHTNALTHTQGALYMQKGDYPEAQSAFKAATVSQPTNINAHFNLAVLLTSKLNQHLPALRHCGTALKLDSSNVKALHLMGNILQVRDSLLWCYIVCNCGIS